VDADDADEDPVLASPAPVAALGAALLVLSLVVLVALCVEHSISHHSMYWGARCVWNLTCVRCHPSLEITLY